MVGSLLEETPPPSPSPTPRRRYLIVGSLLEVTPLLSLPATLPPPRRGYLMVGLLLEVTPPPSHEPYPEEMLPYCRVAVGVDDPFPYLALPKETVPYCGVAVGGDPDAGEVVGVDAVLYELSASVLVHVDAAGLPVVDLALHDGRVRAGLHLKPRDPVVVDVVRFKVTLQNVLEIM